MCIDVSYAGGTAVMAPAKRAARAEAVAPENLLFYGDNLDVLRRHRQHIPDGSVDLVYLDPPFNSNQTYNVLFREQDGSRAASQVKAFEDTWQWDKAAIGTFQQVVEEGGRVSAALQAFKALLGGCKMLAYLTMMAPRLVELHRVLKPTGSLYLHCDSNASHYLKLLTDAVFGPERFVNELIWKRSSAHSDVRQGAKHFGRVSDSILFFSKSAERAWNQLYAPYDAEYVKRDYRRVDADGRRYRLSDLSGPGGAAKGNPAYEVMGVTRHWRLKREKMEELIRCGRVIQTSPGAVPQYKRYLDEMPGVPVQNIWTDVPVINNRSKEKLGFPTQKPLALLERILRTSSNEGGTVLDAFCGCGTAIAAAQKLGRRWIGIDISQVAVGIIRRRLRDMFGIEAGQDYAVIGEPTDLSGAEALARQDRFQFQCWAVNRLCGVPIESKKGADRGIDGRLFFHDESPGGKTKQVILSVKSGGTGPADVRDLRGVIEREKAAIGVLVTLEEPTRPMLREAAEAGHYVSAAWNRKHERVQIITVREVLEGARIDMPPSRFTDDTFVPAPRQKAPPAAKTHDLFGE
jgi:DNA modification methylase